MGMCLGGRVYRATESHSVNFQGARFSVPTKYVKFTLSNGVSRYFFLLMKSIGKDKNGFQFQVPTIL